MDRVIFYKYINKKIVRGKKELIFHNFDENYYDIKDGKVRIGIKNADYKKFKILNKKIKDKFDIIDMRLSLRYGFENEFARKELFNFAKQHLIKYGDIYCFINNEEEIIEQSKNTDVINKGDQIWIPKSETHEIIVKNNKKEDKEEKQYSINMDTFKEELFNMGLRIIKEYSLNKMNKNKDINYIGEYIIQIKE